MTINAALAGRLAWRAAQSAALSVAVGMLSGAGVALFLDLLARATRARCAHEALVYLLPLAGLGLGWLYERYGQPIQAGAGLVLDRLGQGGPELPWRMAPMVLLGTVLTHLFGGSAGREGTAVQIGAGLADWLAHRLRLDERLRALALCAGVAGGFGAAFGTPVAGAVFALELRPRGLIKDTALWALLAALVADLTAHALGAAHTPYPQPAPLPLGPLVLLKWTIFAVAMAAATRAFIALTHAIKRLTTTHLRRLPWRMMVGGLVVVLMWRIWGTSDYLGLGVPMITRAFEDPHLPAHASVSKLLFTAVTIGAGFLGGEVTPLFFVGSTLGNAMARLLELPLAMGAAVGMAAVFAAASHAPLALSIMAVELLGAHVLPHVVFVCALAWLMTGQRSIYPRPALDDATHRTRSP